MFMLLVLVVFSAIFIFFSNEITALFKKWSGVYWVRVIVPLVVVSWTWIWYDEFIPLFLIWLQADFLALVLTPGQFLPVHMQWFAHAISLFVMASLPAWLFYFKYSRDVVTNSQHQQLNYIYFFSWLCFVVLLVV